MVAQLFDGAHYPWTQRRARQVSLNDEIQGRLISAGLLRREENGSVAISHDRILNWAAAETLAERVLDRDLNIEGLYQLLYRILRVDGEWRDDFAVRHLGYLPMDLLWLLADRIGSDELAELIDRLVRGDRLSWGRGAIFEELLPTLGVRILSVLEEWILNHLSDDDSWWASREVAAGIKLAGAGAAAELRHLGARLVTSQDLAVQLVGLSIAAEVAFPEHIERMWELHRQSALRREENEKKDGVTTNRARRTSSAALVCAVNHRPDWIRGKLSEVKSADEVVDLVSLTMKLSRTVGQRVWEENKARFFGSLSNGRRCLPQAIRHFGDEACIDWLLETETESAEHLAVECRFNALVRLDSDKALRLLNSIKPRGEFLFTKSWWLRSLVHRLGTRANTEMTRFFAQGDWTGVRDLAMLFQGYEDLLDDQTLSLIVQTFEARLEAHDHMDDWQLGAERHFLRLLSNVRSPRLLHQLEKMKDSRFEELLVRRAVRLGGRRSLGRRPDTQEYRTVLLKIGADGIAEVLAHDLSSEHVWTRYDALVCAVWQPTRAVRRAVGRLAQQSQHDQDEQVALMEALASFENDEAFSNMLRRGTPADLTALDIRRSKSPIAAKIRERACVDAMSDDENSKQAGITILSLCKGKDATDCLKGVLKSNHWKSKAAHAAVWALDDVGHFSEEVLPFVVPMMADGKQQRVAFNYLLRRGGKAGENAIAEYLASHNRVEVTDFQEQVARILVERGESSGEAAKFLADIIRKRNCPFGYNRNLLALTRSGSSLAEGLLFESSLAKHGFGESPLIAIRGLAGRAPDYVFDTAWRLLENDPEAGGEDVMLQVDPARAVPLLLDLLTKEIGTLHRWRIYRHLRWYAPDGHLKPQLAEMAADRDTRRRQVACDIIGWLSPGSLEGCLHQCVDDIDGDVEKAALRALRKHQKQLDVKELLSEFETMRGPACWSRLYALLDLFDPRTLARDADPLCIWPVLNKHQVEYAMEAEQILKRRVDQEKQSARGVDRDRQQRY